MPGWGNRLAVLGLAACAGAVSCAAPAHAEPSREGWYLGTGLVLSDLYRTASVSTGDLGPVGATYFQLQVAYATPWLGMTLVPSLSFTPIARSDTDQSVSQRLYSLMVALEGRASFGDYRFGTGLRLFQQTGNGGSVVLNNGNSTSTFARPAFDSWARNVFLDLGLGDEVARLGVGVPLRLDLDLWGTSLLSSARALDCALSLSVGWP